MSTTSQSGATEQDVTALVHSQHEQVKALFSQLEKVIGADAEEPFCELRRLLAVHETAEEEVIYPALRSQGEQGGRIADARTDEEDKAKKVLSDLESMGVEDASFPMRLREFATMVIDHAEHEEQEVLPLLRSSQSADQLRSMAAAFRIAEAAAPTHPHPHAPESATGNLLIGPAVAIVDRVRDALRSSKS